MKCFSLMGLVFLFLVLSLSGCGQVKIRPKIQGQVTLQSNPVVGPMLVLYADDPDGENFSQHLALSSEGKFSGEVPRPGRYKVVIEPSLASREGAAPMSPILEQIPVKYRQKGTSDHVLTIEGNNNALNIELAP